MSGRRLSLWLPVAACVALIFLLSHQPGGTLPAAAPDFVAHFVEYAVLGVLLARALNGGMASRPGPGVFVWTVVLCAAWAVLDELHQAFVPGRFASAVDVASDVAGSVAACLLFPALRRLAAPWRPGTADAGGGAGEGPAELIFLTREDCHLCHEAREVLDRVVGDYHVRLEVLDVDSRAELARRYGEEVPVLLVNGSKTSKFRLDERRLRRRLRPWLRRAS